MQKEYIGIVHTNFSVIGFLDRVETVFLVNVKQHMLFGASHHSQNNGDDNKNYGIAYDLWTEVVCFPLSIDNLFVAGPADKALFTQFAHNGSTCIYTFKAVDALQLKPLANIYVGWTDGNTAFTGCTLGIRFGFTQCFLACEHLLFLVIVDMAAAMRVIDRHNGIIIIED